MDILGVCGTIHISGYLSRTVDGGGATPAEMDATEIKDEPALSRDECRIMRHSRTLLRSPGNLAISMDGDLDWYGLGSLASDLLSSTQLKVRISRRSSE